MKRAIVLLFALTLFAGTNVSTFTTTFGETTAKERSSESPKAEEWKKAVEEYRSARDQTTAFLIAVAGDETKPPDEREEAARILAEMGTEKGLQFLIENIDSRLSGFSPSDTDAQRRLFFCKRALYGGGWRAAEAALKALDKPREQTELVALYMVLRVNLSPQVALAAVNGELKGSLPPTRKKNLTAVKIMLLESIPAQEQGRWR